MILSMDADLHFRQGMAHARGRQLELAEQCFRRAAALDPGHGSAFHNLGTALAGLGRHAEAVEAFAGALKIDPDFAPAHFGKGVSLRALGRADEAATSLARAIEIDPGHDEAYYYLGMIHQSAGRLNEALACYMRAVDLSPNDADVYTAMASVLARLRMPSAAVRPLEIALSLNPNDDMARANLMDILANDCDWERLNAHLDRVPDLGVTGGPIAPFAMLTFDDDPARNRARSEKFAQSSYALIEPLPAPTRPASRPERLRIGYFSADFHDHATMFLAARMFELHDRSRFSIHAYSYGLHGGGVMGDRAKTAFDEFKQVQELTNSRIAELARADGIDIAVDLKGYTEFQRVGIFAYRPAPVQITYLGYPGTLGTSFIDYMIADRIVIPDEQRAGYSESLIYLPDSYQVNDDTRALPPAGVTRESAGLPEEGFVFSCFNNAYKISSAEFGIWMELLEEVEGSVLWILASRGDSEPHLRETMRRKGLDPARLIIAPRTNVQAHIARLQHAGLFLDTFNVNAHTTAGDALWAGVPVVTKAGKGFPARVAASLLHAIGLEELVTGNERDYRQLALSLARDPARLAELRARLAANRTTMPLFDSARTTRHIEQAYDLAYERFLKGEQPADINVPA